jgi:hypothetical protein
MVTHPLTAERHKSLQCLSSKPFTLSCNSNLQVEYYLEITGEFSTMNLSGTFVSGEHPTEGTVQIVVESEQRFVELQPDFKTSDLGPDLRVVLHRLEDVIGSTTPPDFPIKEQELFLLDRLQSFTGKQRYLIPSWLDLANYQSVAIWCYAFNATFGAAKLNGQ